MALAIDIVEYNNNVIIWIYKHGIVFYTDQRGTSPVLEFINDLPVFEQAKIRNALRLLKEFGIQLGMPHARHILGKL